MATASASSADLSEDLSADLSEDLSEVEPTVGASFRDELAWHSIDWYQVQRTVRRLQARIVKATREGDA
jgi:N-terminal domain of reverse transcriptase